MGIRMIAVDMDGTCIGDRHRVPGENLNALKKAHKAGILVVPATGRTAANCPSEIRSLPFIRYVISSNGARVTDREKGTTIHEVLIPGTEAREFLLKLRGLPVWTALHMDDRLIDSNLIPSIHRKLVGTGDPAKNRWVPSLPRFLEGRKGGVEKLELFYLTERAGSRIRKLLKEHPKLSCAQFRNHYVEITAAGASKGEALRFLSERMGIPASDVMAIGDSGNDLSMLHFAGYPVAMGNACAEVKRAAVTVTATNARCGVARAVREILP